MSGPGHGPGTVWSRVSSTSPVTHLGLLAVTAASATSAWIVGEYSTRAGNRTLILHWNGTSWSRA